MAISAIRMWVLSNRTGKKAGWWLWAKCLDHTNCAQKLRQHGQWSRGMLISQNADNLHILLCLYALNRFMFVEICLYGDAFGFNSQVWCFILLVIIHWIFESCGEFSYLGIKEYKFKAYNIVDGDNQCFPWFKSKTDSMTEYIKSCLKELIVFGMIVSNEMLPILLLYIFFFKRL